VTVRLVAASTVRALDLPPLRSDSPPYFTADVAIALDRDGHPALGVTVTVPYTEMQWIRRPNGFGAAIQVTVVFEPRGAGRIFGDVWQRRIVVAGFEEAHSAGSSLVEKRTFDVPPGRYQVRVGIRDLDAEQASMARDAIVVPDYSRVPVGFADLELGVVDTTGNFESVPTRRFGLNASRLASRVALFDRRPGPWPRAYSFQYRIRDERGEEVASGVQRVEVPQSAEPVIVRAGASELFVGNYVFEVVLNEGKSRWRVERSFEVEESGPPRGKEFERILEPLSYIAPASEIEWLRSLTPDQQAGGWQEFWRRRDPTPDTPRNEAMLEFFRRLRYTEQHFQGFGPGWRSDMGRIYIKFGPPDQIETRPGSSQMPNIEIWFYNQPYRRFVYVDREGFGRYTLQSSSGE
jgi:GWxTD domain-containing protein